MAIAHPEQQPVYQPTRLPARRQLSRDAPIEWLKRGRDDFEHAPRLSLAYGGLFAAIGMLITWLGLSQPQFILTFWSGFLLVGPLLAMGLYRIAQMRERDEPITLGRCVGRLRDRLGAVALFALLLSIVMIAWIRFSTLAVALYIGNVAGVSGFIAALGSAEGVGFLLLLFGVGALFATAMFALTAWSLPLVLDGRTDIATAVIASVRTTLEQPLPMMRWGAVVAALTLVGMLTFFTTFVVIFPLLGYATWAGYRDLFGRD